jgi:hypothetical protein
MLAGYLVAVQAVFGFWLTPPKFQAVHRVSMSGALDNLVLYGGYIVLLSLPMSLMLPAAARQWLVARWRVAVVALTAVFAIGFAALSDTGEMNFGPLDRVLNRHFANGALMVFSQAVLFPLFFQPPDLRVIARRRMLIAVGVVGVLAVLSLTRPAQRYLLMLLPFYLLALPRGRFGSRALVVAVIASYLAVDLVIGWSQWCSGSAAAQMAREIEGAGLLAATDAGAIESHVGDRFYPTRAGDKAYTVRAGAHANAVLTVVKGIGPASTTYSLVPNQ